MLSPADVIIIGAFALIVFGPDQLPKVARRAGQVVREVQNTSQSFIREMERAADESERKEWTPPPASVEHYADPTPAPGYVEDEGYVGYVEPPPGPDSEPAAEAKAAPVESGGRVPGLTPGELTSGLSSGEPA